MNKFLPKGKVKVIKGSIITPEYAGLKLIVNLVNESGSVDGKLNTVFDKKWKKVKEETKGWYSSRVNFKQGEIKTVAVQSDTWVINCLCKNKDNQVEEKALTTCLKKIAEMAKNEKASVHVSTLLNEESSTLSSLLESEIVDKGINLSYYEEA